MLLRHYLDGYLLFKNFLKLGTSHVLLWKMQAFYLSYRTPPSKGHRFVVFSGFGFVWGMVFPIWFGGFLHCINHLKIPFLFICIFFFHLVFMVARREKMSSFKMDWSRGLLFLFYYGNYNDSYPLFKGSLKLEAIPFRSMPDKQFRELWGERGWWDPGVENRVWVSF